jgi:hypothetical protein
MENPRARDDADRSTTAHRHAATGSAGEGEKNIGDGEEEKKENTKESGGPWVDGDRERTLNRTGRVHRGARGGRDGPHAGRRLTIKCSMKMAMITVLQYYEFLNAQL